MAAAAGRSLLLLLCSRGGGGGAGGCGALTAGCFPGLGVSRHRPHQQHRTVSERGSGEGGAAWGAAGRPGRPATSLNSRPPRGGRPPSRRVLQRLRRRLRRQGGRAGGREAGEEEEEGRQQGCSRRTGDARAGKARDLNLSLTRLRARSLLPTFLTALLQCSRTEPGASCRLLSSSGRVGASGVAAVAGVSGEWQCHAAGNCPRRAPRDPRRLLPRPLSAP